jgi:hypothetical protein
MNSKKSWAGTRTTDFWLFFTSRLLGAERSSAVSLHSFNSCYSSTFKFITEQKTGSTQRQAEGPTTDGQPVL